MGERLEINRRNSEDIRYSEVHDDNF